MSTDKPNNPINQTGPEHLPLFPRPEDSKGPKYVLQFHLAITGPDGPVVRAIGMCPLPSNPYTASLSCESYFDSTIGEAFKADKNDFFAKLISENAKSEAKKQATPTAPAAEAQDRDSAKTRKAS